MMSLLGNKGKLQEEIAKFQQTVAQITAEGTAGGGMVTVKVSGDLVVKSITIDPDAVDPEDVEMLQDLVLAATNEALRSAQELASAKLGGITGGLTGGLGDLGLPGF